jgi:hypothetical protein
MQPRSGRWLAVVQALKLSRRQLETLECILDLNDDEHRLRVARVVLGRRREGRETVDNFSSDEPELMRRAGQGERAGRSLVGSAALSLSLQLSVTTNPRSKMRDDWVKAGVAAGRVAARFDIHTPVWTTPERLAARIDPPLELARTQSHDALSPAGRSGSAPNAGLPTASKSQEGGVPRME